MKRSGASRFTIWPASAIRRSRASGRPAERAGIAQSTASYTLERFAAGQHLTIAYAEGWRPFWHDEMLRLGIRLVPALTLPSFGGAERLIAGSELILTAPSGLARLFSPALKAVPAPFDCGFDVNMMWTPRTDNSARHRRIREMIRQAATDPALPLPLPKPRPLPPDTPPSP